MLKQEQRLIQTGKLSPQQIQLMNQIRLNIDELEQEIEKEISENPALERDDLDYNPNQEQDDYSDVNKATNSKNEESTLGSEIEDQNDYSESNTDTDRELDFDITSYGDDEIPDYQLNDKYGVSEERDYFPVKYDKSFHQYIMEQVNNLNIKPELLPAAEFLAGSIDDNGYIQISNDDIIDNLAFNHNFELSHDDLEILFNKIQSLDPPGIGARNLRECLLIQLKRKNNPSKDTKNALRIVHDHFSLYADKHFKKLLSLLNISENEFRKASKIISNLNPKPGSSLSGTYRRTYLIPDFKLTVVNDQINLDLNRGNLPKLKVSNTFKELLDSMKRDKNQSKANIDTFQYLKKKLELAQNFINLVHQRYNTLQTTVYAIIEQQRNYLLTGDETQLKPLTLRDIAETIDMDISTVSRVTSGKYIETPYGVKLLKDFFSESMRRIDGTEISSIELKNAIKNMVAEENKNQPYSDLTIAKMLEEKGYDIARRTVAKYREQLKIPVSRLRKKLK